MIIIIRFTYIDLAAFCVILSLVIILINQNCNRRGSFQIIKSKYKGGKTRDLTVIIGMRGGVGVKFLYFIN